MQCLLTTSNQSPSYFRQQLQLQFWDQKEIMLALLKLDFSPKSPCWLGQCSGGKLQAHSRDFVANKSRLCASQDFT